MKLTTSNHFMSDLWTGILLLCSILMAMNIHTLTTGCGGRTGILYFRHSTNYANCKYENAPLCSWNLVLMLKTDYDKFDSSCPQKTSFLN